MKRLKKEREIRERRKEGERERGESLFIIFLFFFFFFFSFSFSFSFPSFSFLRPPWGETGDRVVSSFGRPISSVTDTTVADGGRTMTGQLGRSESSSWQ